MKEKIDFKKRAQTNIIQNFVVDAQTFLEGDIPQIDFLVPGCIPRGNVILLSGESGGGKSFIAYELVRAIASGTAWLGRGAPLEGPQPVLILNYDNPTDTLKFRLVKLGFTGEMPFYIHTQGIAPKLLVLPSEAEKLRIIIDYFQPALTIVDSLRQSNTFNENDSQEMAALMGIFKNWTNTDSKNTVVILHHTSKTGEGGWKASARGSGEIVASSDVVIQVVAESGPIPTGKITWTKTRTWEIGPVNECTFEIKDQYIGDEENLELIINVKATSELPGEEARTIDTLLMKIFSENKHHLTRSEIYEKTKPVKKILIDAAIKRAINSNKIKFRKTNTARTYGLVK